MPLKHINPEGWAKPPGYTHVVEARGSRIVYLAGQTPIDKDGNVVGTDLRTQAAQVYKNIETCLATVGATFENVTKMTTFVVNYTPESRAAIMEARQQYLPAEPPAHTLLGIQALARPEFLLEIEATAVLD